MERAVQRSGGLHFGFSGSFMPPSCSKLAIGILQFASTPNAASACEPPLGCFSGAEKKLQLRRAAFLHRNRGVRCYSRHYIHNPARPLDLHACNQRASDAEVERLATLRPEFTTAAAIVLAKSNPISEVFGRIGHCHACADPINIGLHAM